MIWSEISLSECRLGFIGAGNMALAIAQGFIKSGQISAEQMSASAPTDRNLNKFKDLGCFTTNINNDIFNGTVAQKGPKLVFLCIKPIVFKSLQNNESIKQFLDISRLIGDGSKPVVVVSVMAGIRIEQLRQTFSLSASSQSVRIIRLMPNTAAAICSGICGISVDYTGADDQFCKFLTDLLSLIGWPEFVSEPQLNAVCGLGGSGIAFVYSLIHAMSDGGLKMGLTRSVSQNIAAQTVLGAALMVKNSGKNPVVLRDEVTSPGGTTIHGLHALERGSFGSVVMDAIESATKRAEELSHL